MPSPGQLAGLLVVSALWGCTNPFLKRANDKYDDPHAPSKQRVTQNDQSSSVASSSTPAPPPQHTRGACTWAWRVGRHLLALFTNWQVSPTGGNALLVVHLLERGAVLRALFVEPEWLPCLLLPAEHNGCGRGGGLVWLLGTSHAMPAAELSVAVPLCNSLTFVFTAITGYMLGERSSMNACACRGWWSAHQLSLSSMAQTPLQAWRALSPVWVCA